MKLWYPLVAVRGFFNSSKMTRWILSCFKGEPNRAIGMNTISPKEIQPFCLMLADKRIRSFSVETECTIVFQEGLCRHPLVSFVIMVSTSLRGEEVAGLRNPECAALGAEKVCLKHIFRVYSLFWDMVNRQHQVAKL